MTSKLAINRVKKEIEDFRKNENDGYNIKVDVYDTNLFHLKAQITGPVDTPYHLGTYYLDIKLGEKYPFLPPKINFITKIWHPNISSVTGLICLDILKSRWLASMSLRSVLMSILALLAEPIPEDAQDGMVAKQLLNNKDEFYRTANYWKLFYATDSSAEDRMRQHPYYETKLMEFKSHPLVLAKKKCESELLGVLSSNEWNMERALNCI